MMSSAVKNIGKKQAGSRQTAWGHHKIISQTFCGGNQGNKGCLREYLYGGNRKWVKTGKKESTLQNGTK